MTGKDFSGPTPEIRAPVALTLAEPESNTNEEQIATTRGRVKPPPPAVEESGEEVLGDVSSFIP